MSDFEKVNFFTDRSIQDDPYPYFDWVRSQSPVWQEPNHGMFMITGHPEAMTVYGDPASFPEDSPPVGDVLLVQRGERIVRRVFRSDGRRRRERPHREVPQ